jgi:hypothetical protein
MKYICLCYKDQTEMSAKPEAELHAMMRDVFAYNDELKSQGKLVACEGLQPVSTATTIRVRDGKAELTDGPFAETKEQLGGFFLIEANDLDEALRLATKMPSAREGCIELRPVRELS